MGDLLSEIRWGVIEAFLLIPLSLALAIGSIRGRTRLYRDAIVHFLFGVTGGIVAVLVLHDPTDRSFAVLALTMLMLAALATWMITCWSMHFSVIMQRSAGVAVEPRPLLAFGCFEASCLASITFMEITPFATAQVGAGTVADVVNTTSAVFRVTAYALAIAMLALTILVGLYHVRNLIVYRRQQRNQR